MIPEFLADGTLNPVFEINRKAIDEAKRIVEMKLLGQMSAKEASVRLETLWLATAGIIDKEVSSAISSQSNEWSK